MSGGWAAPFFHFPWLDRVSHDAGVPDDSQLINAADYTPTPRTRVMRAAFTVATVAVLAAGCGGMFLATPPAPLLFTPPLGFVLALQMHGYTAKQERLLRKPKINFFVLGVLALMIFMGYVPMVWKQQGWSEPLRIALGVTNVAVQLFLFIAFFRQPYERLGTE